MAGQLALFFGLSGAAATPELHLVNNPAKAHIALT
jgi:hypothetical protein